MSVVGTRVSVGTSPTKIYENAAPGATLREDDFRAINVLLKNLTATVTIFLGDSNVTVSAGYSWEAADGGLTTDLEPGEAIWGIVAAGSQSVAVLKQGR